VQRVVQGQVNRSRDERGVFRRGSQVPQVNEDVEDRAASPKAGGS
jgi:hypothetical protein